MDPKIKFASIKAQYKESCQTERVYTDSNLHGREQKSSLVHYRKLLSPTSELGKETSKSVANCIRGLNATIGILTKENAELRQRVEDISSSRLKDAELKKLLDANKKLKEEMNEMHEKNKDLQEKYTRIKEMYDGVVDKIKFEKEQDEDQKDNAGMDELIKKNKKLIEMQRKQVAEIENLKSQIRIFQQSIEELEDGKKGITEKSQKAEMFMSDLADLNDHLLNFIKSKSSSSPILCSSAKKACPALVKNKKATESLRKSQKVAVLDPSFPNKASYL